MSQGLVVDEIDECTSRPLQADKTYNNVDMAVGAGMFAWHGETAQIAASLKSEEGSKWLKDTSFWRTLAVNTTNMGGTAPSSFGKEYLRVLEYLALLDHCDYDAAKVAAMPKAKALEILANDSSFVGT